MSFGLLSLLLLAKMVLNTRIIHYGFFLAMPATLFLLTVLLSWLPRHLESRGGFGSALRILTLTVLLLTLGAYLGIAQARFAAKTHEVGMAGDRFRAGQRGKHTARMLEHIEAHIEPGQTLAVLPEGVMLNYLSRRATSIPFINFMPPELLMFGEDSILHALEEAPPDFIALVHKNTAEYGARFFGTHYGQRIMCLDRTELPRNRTGRRPPVSQWTIRDVSPRAGALNIERYSKEGIEPDKAGSAMYRFAIPVALFAFATFLLSLQCQRVFLEGHVRFSDPDAYYHMRRIAYTVYNFPATLDFDPMEGRTNCVFGNIR